MATTPIVVGHTNNFIGNDGHWSSIALSVGTPSQVFQVLPATGSQETWIPVEEACRTTNSSGCPLSRGAYSHLFHPNTSTSWKEIGLYDLALGNELGYEGNGVYGLDTVKLELSASQPVALDSQVVAGIATGDFWTGLLGSGPRPVNFSNMDHSVPSFLGTMREQERIPSLSYGYSAGASYRKSKTPGNLVLGGYDESRFEKGNGRFPFGSDSPLSLFIQSITSSDSLKGQRTTLLDDSQVAYATIDSSIPHLWLPREVCDRFEEAFGLKYDAKTDLYLIGHADRQSLLSKNASITIGLGVTSDPMNRTNIVLPYAAFDLQASAPIYTNTTYYFPIRRANKSQYRLGRTFLQEAYLIADYERREFSVHQVHYEEVMPRERIIAILPKNETSAGQVPTPPAGLGRKEIAGIAVGACVAGTMCIALAVLLYRRWRSIQEQKRKSFLVQGGHHPHMMAKGMVEVGDGAKKINQLHEDALQEMLHPPTEVSGIGRRPALISDDIESRLVELPAESVQGRNESSEAVESR